MQFLTFRGLHTLENDNAYLPVLALARIMSYCTSACSDYCISMTDLTFNLVPIKLIRGLQTTITCCPRPFQPCSYTPGARSRRV